jgi:25S rRNA (uracil2634-N3)-methyltransferase
MAKGPDEMDHQLPCVLRARSDAAPSAMPYTAEDRLLVLGDGDFSFSAAVGLTLRHAPLLTASSYDSLAALTQKYVGKEGGGDALAATAVLENLADLRRRKATVLYSVDATDLESSLSDGQLFDFILFNFPHSGTDENLEESIKENTKLLRDFFGSASRHLAPGGELHVTLMDRYPYTAWNVAVQAETGTPGLLQHCGHMPFVSTLYPGYMHVATTKKDRKHGIKLERCSTHVWRLAESDDGDDGSAKVPSDTEVASEEAPKRNKDKKRKRETESDSD